ncbi:MAG TPA: hypothetical protein VEG64_14655 [Candidatus Sulfotelmatobacter sp.]|nr:hypothetical protein [Candidatus Sulfotelmatobacter sp.]
MISTWRIFRWRTLSLFLFIVNFVVVNTGSGGVHPMKSIIADKGTELEPMVFVKNIVVNEETRGDYVSAPVRKCLINIWRDYNWLPHNGIWQAGLLRRQLSRRDGERYGRAIRHDDPTAEFQSVSPAKLWSLRRWQEITEDINLNLARWSFASIGHLQWNGQLLSLFECDPVGECDSHIHPSSLIHPDRVYLLGHGVPLFGYRVLHRHELKEINRGDDDGHKQSDGSYLVGIQLGNPPTKHRNVLWLEVQSLFYMILAYSSARLIIFAEGGRPLLVMFALALLCVFAFQFVRTLMAWLRTHSRYNTGAARSRVYSTGKLTPNKQQNFKLGHQQRRRSARNGDKMNATKMSIKVTGRFATAEDTARVLGVPKARLKWLKNLVTAELNHTPQNGRTASRASKKVSTSGRL